MKLVLQYLVSTCIQIPINKNALSQRPRANPIHLYLGLRTLGEEITLTARPMYRPKFSYFFDLCLGFESLSSNRKFRIQPLMCDKNEERKNNY